MSKNYINLNKKPPIIRYIFIIQGEQTFTAMTHRTLGEWKNKSLSSIRVVDLKLNLVNRLKEELLSNLLDEWRENYLNYEWSIPYQFFQ